MPVTLSEIFEASYNAQQQSLRDAILSGEVIIASTPYRGREVRVPLEMADLRQSRVREDDIYWINMGGL